MNLVAVQEMIRGAVACPATRQGSACRIAIVNLAARRYGLRGCD